MTWNRNLPVCLAVLFIGSFLGSANAAKDALEQELNAMVSEHVIPLVEKRGGGALAVGGFTAATRVKGNAGPEIQLKLSRLLKEAGARVDPDEYQYEITGNYLPYNDQESKLQGVKLVGRLVDAEDGTTLGEFPRFVFGPEAVPRLLGLSVDTRGSNDPRIQSAAFQKAMKQPQTFLLGSQVSATPASQYAVEVLARRGGQWRTFPIRKDRKARPFVDLARDDVYAIRLLNHSDCEAAVRLTIDGVSVFQFSQQRPRPNYWIVPPKNNGQPGATLVRGWDKTSSSTLEFKVVDFPSSAAAKVNLRPTSNIGTITASFSACWANERDRPRGEGRTRATGFGKEIVDNKTRLKRHVGQVREVVSVRYERETTGRDNFAVNR